MEPEEIFTIVNAALTGIVIFPVFVFGLLSFFQAHSRKDPARNGVRWLRLVFPFFFLSLVLTVASDAMYIVILLGVDGDEGFYQASNYLFLVAAFFEHIATICTLVAMLEIGLGFLYIQKPPQGTSTALNNKDAHIIRDDIGDGSKKRDHYKMIHIAAAVVGVVLFALAVALLGKACNAYAVYYSGVTANDGSDSDSTDYDEVIDRYLAAIHIARDLGATVDILIWILAFPLIGFAGYLVYHARLQRQPSTGATILLLVATLFWFVRFTWHLAYNVAWLLPSGSNGAPIWFDAVDPELDVWTFFAVLVLLYVIVARRAGGLWSTSQPWMLSGAGAGVGGGGASFYQPVYNPGYGPAGYGYPQQVHQLPGNEQPRTFHEMYQPQQPQQYQIPVNPQELYAPNQYVQQYQGQSVVGSPQPTVSSTTAIQPTPPPMSGYSGTPPHDLKA
ncbi:hypothetical protein SCUCBS95973_001830 [Sporothrix curviconia]|uniref:Uncharacterized protein n=1 Tax=Sporothrix curviconia TaxID=1260050 RepID=A0ABP0B1Z6_9PEZI